MKKLTNFLLLFLIFSCTSNSNFLENDLAMDGKPVSDNSFTCFFDQFTGDSLFQMEHINFPIRGTYSSYDENIEWSKNDWKHMDFELNDVIDNVEDSVSVIQNDSSYFLGTYCKECGFSFEMKFEIIENNWFLVYRQENNF